jgi:hypothetical protein
MRLETDPVQPESVVVIPSANSLRLLDRSVKLTKERAFVTNSSRPKWVRLFGFTMVALVLAATCRADEIPSAAQEMAKTYGLDPFGQIEGIRYTWNAEVPGSVKPFDGGPGTITISRKWEWDPKTDTVSFEGKTRDGEALKVNYQRSQLSSQSDAVKTQVDPLFFNDQYWLLIPLHASWDTSAKVTDDGMQKLSLGDGSADRIVVKYPSEGGYLPGDTWELYVGPDHRVQELIFRRGGSTKPGLVIVTWADYKKVGPLDISTDHRGTADGNPLRIYFSDLSVKLTGSDNWIKAQ